MHLTQLEIKQLHWTSFRKGNLDIKGKTKNIHSSMSKQDWETQPAEISKSETTVFILFRDKYYGIWVLIQNMKTTRIHYQIIRN